MRICSTIPAATEILFSLGLGDQVVGVSYACDYPAAAQRKPLIVTSVVEHRHLRSDQIDQTVIDSLRRGQSLYQVDLEVLRDTQPELVVTQDLCDVCAVTIDDVRAAIRELSPPPRLVSLHPHSLAEMLEGIRQVGLATNRGAAAEEIVRDLQLRLDRVRAKTAQRRPRPRTLCIEWLKPLMTGGHWVPEMVALAGGAAGLAEPGKPSPYVTWDAVRAYAPEALFLMPCGLSVERTLRELELVTALPGWSELPAVVHQRAYAVNGDAFFNRAGPRLVDGVELLARLLHPEAGPWPEPPAGAVRPLS